MAPRPRTKVEQAKQGLCTRYNCPATVGPRRRRPSHTYFTRASINRRLSDRRAHSAVATCTCDCSVFSDRLVAHFKAVFSRGLRFRNAHDSNNSSVVSQEQDGALAPGGTPGPVDGGASPARRLRARAGTLYCRPVDRVCGESPGGASRASRF